MLILRLVYILYLINNAHSSKKKTTVRKRPRLSDYDCGSTSDTAGGIMTNEGTKA